jgi:hypothetical protein
LTLPPYKIGTVPLRTWASCGRIAACIA